ncbi:MAG TPA: polysaccharide deacetylase family protein [Propylenella sp.]|nr:polysaccharide deacetylase family protein [Propylenella sp.]
MPQSRKEVVIHADDLGMCHGANLAFLELFRRGVCTCGSVMVPGPWSSEMADLQARFPDLDIGVHLTLNAEKQHYRWRPLTRSQHGGLVDSDGYFWQNVQDLRRNAHPDAVEAELRAQIEAALAAGIDVTHLDDHMGAVFCPEFVGVYVRLGREYRLPILIMESIQAYDPRHNLDEVDDGGVLAAAAAAARAYGSPVFEAVLETPWRRGKSVESDYRALFARAPKGLSFFALHFTVPGEVEAIEPETASIRTQEYALFRSSVVEEILASGGYVLRGMRAFRAAMRDSGASTTTAPPQSLLA